MTGSGIPFVDMAAQRQRIGASIDEAMLRVARHGAYIMGPEVGELERQLATFTGARHAISCASGTDALLLVLMGLDLPPGGAVFVPSFTFAATAEVVALLGGTPVFVDVDKDSFNLDPESLLRGIAAARELGLPLAGVMPVDLFGLPAEYDAIAPIAEEHGLWLLCDAAQSLGATYGDRKVGSIGRATATSFFPAKPLGCYGDGGAIFTDDDGLAAVIRSLRVHGQGTDKYDNVRIGLNGRIDTLQAAILLEKLKIFGDEIDARNRVAERYGDTLADVVAVPRVPQRLRSAWAQYTIRVQPEARAALAEALKSEGIPTAIYYPKPLHRQVAYARFPTAGRLTASEELAREVISLPMHPYLDEATQDRIVDAVHRALAHEADERLVAHG